MANINIDNIKSTSDILIKNNILASIKQLELEYQNSILYQQAKISTNTEVSLISKEIEQSINTLSTSLEKFSNKLNDYINDYEFLNQYLTTGIYNDIKSNFVKTNLKNIMPIENNELEKIKVINLIISIDDENNKET